MVGQLNDYTIMPILTLGISLNLEFCPMLVLMKINLRNSPYMINKFEPHCKIWKLLDISSSFYRKLSGQRAFFHVRIFAEYFNAKKSQKYSFKHLLIFISFETKILGWTPPPLLSQWDKIWANVISHRTLTQQFYLLTE